MTHRKKVRLECSAAAAAAKGSKNKQAEKRESGSGGGKAKQKPPAALQRSGDLAFLLVELVRTCCRLCKIH